MKFVYWTGWTFFKWVNKTFLDFQVIHPEKLIQSGPVLVASNHASFLDPPTIGGAYDDSIYYLARKTLFVGPMGWLYRNWNAIPVDQERPDFSSLKTVIKRLREGNRVLVFPEGERTTTGEFLPGKPGVGLIIAKANAPVQPIRLFGTFEALPRGVHWLRCFRVTLVVGDPITFTKDEIKKEGVSTKDSYQAVADRVMEEIDKLQLPTNRSI